MASKKKYIVASVTLGVIAMASGLLIGGANIITKDSIKKNQEKKIASGISEIYGKNALISKKIDVKADTFANVYKTVEQYYEVSDKDNNKQGYAFRTNGSNAYGKITLIVGFDETTHAFKGISIVVDEQTYNTTLEDNYISLINKGERDVEDVKCGATFGAKLVREMINEATSAAQELWKE